MTLAELRTAIASRSADFKEVIAYVDDHYAFTPTAFRNGDIRNAAGENNGSCKLFSFAKLQGWSEAETLAAFGDFYFDHVLNHPEGADHQNIRNFIRHGWRGVRFEGDALAPLAKS